MKWLKNKLLKHLFKAVTAEDLKSEWKRLSEAIRQQYKAEAEAILKYDVTDWLKGEMEKNAMRMLFLKSKTEEDMLFGKALLHSEAERMKVLKNIIKQ